MKIFKTKKHLLKSIQGEDEEEPIQGEEGKEVEEYNHDEAIKRKERKKYKSYESRRRNNS